MKNKKKILYIIYIFMGIFAHAQDTISEIAPAEIMVEETYDEESDANDSDTVAVNQPSNDEYEDYSYQYEPYQVKIKPNIKGRYKDEIFNYDRKVKEKPKKNIDLTWLEVFLEIVFYGVILLFALLILFVIYKLITNYIENKQNRHVSSKVLLQQTIEDEEAIENNNYQHLVTNAEQVQNYRLAFRYQFNWILQETTEKKHIAWHKKKTNSDYVFELREKPYSQDFKQMAYTFDYVWYGEFPLGETQYTMLKNQANQLRSRI